MQALTETVPGPDYGQAGTATEPGPLRKHHKVVIEGDPTGRRQEDSHHARVTDQTALDRLYLGNRIDHRKYAAALRLLGAFTRAGMSPLLTIDFGRAGTGRTAQTWSDGQIAAREDTNNALKAICPLNDVIWDFVLCDKGLTEIEIARKWRPTTAFIVLDLGLESLASYYESLEKRR